MPRTTPTLLPRVRRILEGVGQNIRRARLRRAYAAETVSQRAAISRSTLVRVERGDAAVALGIYARVLQAVGLERDLEQIALDDVLGRKLQDARLGERVRAPRRKELQKSLHPTQQ